jgi:DNA recombination protein RmuC
MLEQMQRLDKQVESKLSDNLKEGFHHFEKIQEHLTLATEKLHDLKIVGESIEDLNKVLKMPHLRGSFGEAELEKILSDFLPSGSYQMQAKVDPQGLDRVDALVKMNKAYLPIDSKFPREALLPLFVDSDSHSQESAKKALMSWAKSQAKSIASKYIRPDCGTTDMAFLFLPSESIYFELIRNLECFQAITKLRVFPVSPNTLALSLQAIQLVQESHHAAKNVMKTLEDLQKARKHFVLFAEKFSGVGVGLKKAQENFEMAFQQLSRYEMTLLKFQDHDITKSDE